MCHSPDTSCAWRTFSQGTIASVIRVKDSCLSPLLSFLEHHTTQVRIPEKIQPPLILMEQKTTRFAWGLSSSSLIILLPRNSPRTYVLPQIATSTYTDALRHERFVFPANPGHYAAARNFMQPHAEVLLETFFSPTFTFGQNLEISPHKRQECLHAQHVDTTSFRHADPSTYRPAIFLQHQHSHNGRSNNSPSTGTYTQFAVSHSESATLNRRINIRQSFVLTTILAR